MSEVIYDSIADALDLTPIKFDNDTGAIAFDPVINCLEAIKRNKELRQCPHCKREGHGPNMDRWHFDNCSLIEDKHCKGCGDVIPKIYKAYRYYKTEYCNSKCYHESRRGMPGRPHTNETKKRLSIAALKTSENRSKRMKEIWVSGRHPHSKN